MYSNKDVAFSARCFLRATRLIFDNLPTNSPSARAGCGFWDKRPNNHGHFGNDSFDNVRGSGPPIDFGQNCFRMKSLKHIAGNVPVAGPLQWES